MIFILPFDTKKVCYHVCRLKTSSFMIHFDSFRMYIKYGNNYRFQRIMSIYELRHEKTCFCSLRFRYINSTIPQLPKSLISSFYPSTVVAKSGFRLPWSKTPKTDFLATWLILPRK